MSMVTDKVVLVSGSSRGIGAYLASWFLSRGAVVEGCSRSEGSIADSRYTHHRVDVSDEKQVLAMMACIRRRHGRLDILINNAAISSMNHSLLTPGETMQRIMQTNFGGTFLLCREAAKLMQHSGGGQIVNFSSVAVPLKIAGESIYAASKAAVECLTRVLAIELAPFGITSNALGPGPVDTDLLRNVPQEKIDKVVARTASKRKSTLEDISNVVEFYIRPESRNITGQVIYIGGV